MNKYALSKRWSSPYGKKFTKDYTERTKPNSKMRGKWARDLNRYKGRTAYWGPGNDARVCQWRALLSVTIFRLVHPAGRMPAAGRPQFSRSPAGGRPRSGAEDAAWLQLVTDEAMARWATGLLKNGFLKSGFQKQRKHLLRPDLLRFFYHLC